MTVPEAATFAGRDPETIRRWIRQGRLRSERIGTQYLVERDDVLSMLPDEPLALPAHWRVGDTGPMVEWERLVRDGRRSR